MPIDPLIRLNEKKLVHKPLLTQGAIIQGLKLSKYGYKIGPYYGFLITARCDLAQLKTDTLSFLPIVPLREWLNYSCAINILQKKILSLSQKILKSIQNIDPDLESIFRGELKLEIFNDFVKQNDEYSKNDINNLERSLIEYEEYVALFEKCRTEDQINSIIDKDNLFSKLFKKNKGTRIKEAIKNRDADVYYLPVVDTSSEISESDGYIILFRYIITIPSDYIEILEDGCIKFSAKDDINDYLVAPTGVISNVSSPYVEHIMQRFSSLYSRIGVEDYSEIYVEEFTKRYLM